MFIKDKVRTKTNKMCATCTEKHAEARNYGIISIKLISQYAAFFDLLNDLLRDQ